ncbi:MAG: ABC-2 family transporter protein [Treponema sp.]|nr:ABC-2 family transporter protein [Treponema sp.]
MKKYLEVFRLSFKMQIVWRFDVAMTMAATAGRILAAWILWRAIFSNTASINGFSFVAMLSYYIVSSILSSIDFSSQISGEVSGLIRNGRFSGHMVTPMNPLYFFGSLTAGESAFHLGFSLLAAVLCAVLFGINILIVRSFARIILALALILAGLAFMACYHYTIGVLTFKFLEIDFFMHVQGSIISFATGALVPLSLLPGAVLSALRFLPFTHVVYTPVMLLCGQTGLTDGLFGLAVIAVWTLVMFTIAEYTYGRLRVKYDGVGI